MGASREKSKGERDIWDTECYVFVYFSKLMVHYFTKFSKELVNQNG